MATIVVKGLSSGESGELRYTIDEIQRIFGREAVEAAPTSNRTLSFRFPPRCLKLEALAFNAFTPFTARFWRIIMESLVQLYAERFQKQVGPYNAPEYRKEMVLHTDFWKYKGMLGKVFDLNSAAHVHFIDGTDGGFALVARQLKEQIAG